MWARIAAFELRLQLRSPVFWIGFVLFALLAFGATTMDQIQIGARGNVNVNSPYAILQTVGIMSVFGIFVVTAFVAGAVIRDDETGFAPILRATRLRKPDYVFGRFAGALVVAFAVIAAAPLGIALGSWMPWLDPARLGPFRAGDYVYALLAFALPSLVVIAAGFFALATATRSLMWTYIGAVASLVLFVVTRALLRDPAFDTAGALADPFGLVALQVSTKYWTATERNTQLPPLAGLMLANRALWLGIGLALLALAYAAFRMDGAPLWRRRPPAPAAPEVGPPRVAPAPIVLAPASPRRAGWAQFLSLARFDARQVFRSPAFFVLMAIGVFNAFGGLWYANQLYGTVVFPVTRIMVQALEGSFSLITIIVAVYYAGELVWRDRQLRMHEIVDATPTPDAAHVLPKVLAIAGVLVAVGVVGVLTALGVQLLRGYTQFEIGRYLLWYLWPQTVQAILLAVLAVFVQTLVPHKAVGWAVMLVYVVAGITLGTLGFEHNAYQYAGVPPVPLSDMNGQGHFWIGRTWFQAYWSAFAVMLVVLALALRRRGGEMALKSRLARLSHRLRGAPGWTLGGAAGTWALLGGWILVNTTLWNDYRPVPEVEALQARYEKTLLPFETQAQPTITDVELEVQLYPRTRQARVKGRYLIENRQGTALGEVHVRWMRPLRMRSLEVDGARLARSFDDLDYRVYRFEPALQPGERRELRFVTERGEVGFANDGGDRRLIGNGSFLNSFEIAPLIGMSRDLLLQDRGKRRKHGLPPELRMARLEDESARRHHYLRKDSDWVNASITLVTDADQTPVAPGAVVSDTTRDGRRTLVTRTEAPIQHFFSLQSARYEVKSRDHRGIQLAVYHQQGHAYNADRMLDAMARSLDLFSAAFSPFQFKQMRIVEFPAYENFAQSFAGTVPYSEGIGFVIDTRDSERIDMVTYVTAHEVAHQWWAHQVIGADRQGSTMLSETFAQYGALLVMERLHGKAQIRKFLKYELDRYLRARGGELIEELPLVRVEGQPYIHYQKGALAMYGLKEAVGEAVVNRALRRLLEQFAFKAAPYPSSTDFLRLLREEAGPQHQALITDLFERITLLDAKVTSARSSPRPDGRWDVEIEVQATKRVADGKGAETEVPLDEPLDIGVFSAEPGRKGFDAQAVLHLARQPIRSGTQTLRLVVDREPAFAGVDPYNVRIDRNSDDNLRPVERR